MCFWVSSGGLGRPGVIRLTGPWVQVPFWPRSFSAPVTFGGSAWVCAGAVSSNLKETVLSVPAWSRANSGTNLIKQTGRSCGSVAQW